MNQHGGFSGVAGWFAINSEAAPAQSSAAYSLCGLGIAHGINCAVVTQSGKHDWTFASTAFATALPWMAGQLRTPGAPPVPLPTPPPPSPNLQAAAR
jgi:S-formylglutathione hydrolase FrmB